MTRNKQILIVRDGGNRCLTNLSPSHQLRLLVTFTFYLRIIVRPVTINAVACYNNIEQQLQLPK